MTTEKIKKPKCRGVWKLVIENGRHIYKCTKCGKRLSLQQGRDALNHIDQ